MFILQVYVFTDFHRYNIKTTVSLLIYINLLLIINIYFNLNKNLTLDISYQNLILDIEQYEVTVKSWIDPPVLGTSFSNLKEIERKL